MDRFTVNEFEGVLVGTCLYLALFILHEYWFQLFVRPNADLPLDINYKLAISIIINPLPAVVSACAISYFNKRRGLLLGFVIGILSAVFGIVVDRLLFNQVYGSGNWFILASAFSGVILPATLAGGVGELLGRNRDEKL